jgi:SAM-dependent methyltransferase
MKVIDTLKHSIKARGLKETLLIIINDLLFSLKHSVKFNESIPLNYLNIASSNRINGVLYQSSSYYYVKLAFQNLPIDFKHSSIIDFGSGKGNVLLMLNRLGFKKILGIEFAEDLILASKKNIKNIQKKHSDSEIGVICTDAVQYDIPSTYDVFFFYNPFNRSVFEKVLINIERSLELKKRTIYIIYINAVISEEMFLKFNYKRIYSHSSKIKTEILILAK